MHVQKNNSQNLIFITTLKTTRKLFVSSPTDPAILNYLQFYHGPKACQADINLIAAKIRNNTKKTVFFLDSFAVRQSPFGSRKKKLP
ncbi:hypothetical protein GSUB_04705 [Geoalkalibacter subterraneus]|uniref:Uncharacterized protein n=1 Tax=Geoalkalibacter subterraneus TaxID=483547 RepID=A0A0B5FMZ0_9BACT|nr:hypothetical protein GSUB_04705 [Geoalkalibacter subterraneus]